MKKHTPGPWHVQNFVAPNSNFQSATKIIGFDGIHIAHMTGNSTEANARLTAAAPEMLEALERLVDACSFLSVNNRDLLSFQTEAAREALAKARGES